MRRMALVEHRVMQAFPVSVQVWHQHQAPTAPSHDHGPLLRRLRRWLGQPALAQPRITGGQRDHSLTHAGQSLFALAVKGSVAGVGIDFEPWRALDARHQQLMLTPRERLLMPQATARQLLRIWTVKEACFKADHGGQQRWVTAYELQQPARTTGTARVVAQGHIHRFHYLSLNVADGVLSVAIKVKE